MKKMLFALLFAYFSIVVSCLTLNAQTTLSLGDIAFVAYNSDSSVPSGTGNDQFGFVCLVDISSSTVINFTDQGWFNAGGFRSDPSENTITVTFSSALTCGSQVYIDADGGVKNQAGTTVGSYTGTPLSFVISGDQIFAYQGSAPADNTPAQLAKFVAAIHMNCASCSTSNWDGDATSSTTSAKPAVFIATGAGTNTTYFSSEVDNSRYDCSITGDNPTAIANAVYNQSNWDTDNSQGFAPFNCSFSCTVLPVELVSFKAQKRKNDVELIWRTASELNNFGFEVQRSEDGKYWKHLTFVEGIGTTNTIQSYSFVDTQPLLGYGYYRLKQVDYDGAFEHSEIRTVRISQGDSEMSVFPNPAKDLLRIDLSKTIRKNGKWEYRIFNLAGALVQQKWIVLGNGDLELDVSTLEKGFYIVEVKGMEITHVARFVKE
ncbi:MAG: T9SS type A sorting domain-containing protein [Saprospiraceae bacterium]